MRITKKNNNFFWFKLTGFILFYFFKYSFDLWEFGKRNILGNLLLQRSLIDT